MTRQKTCFVISPIGGEGTDVRARANDFLELLVEPALQRFEFEVIRADKIQKPTAITGDIIRFVQESDLCLIDLTDSNPNVFYECGRRHETGKPFIQLVEKTNLSSIPFDVSGIRTIPYDLSSPRNVLKSVQELQGYIQSILDVGLQSGNTGESLSSIAQGIERLERKVNLMMSNGPSSAPTPYRAGKSSLEFMMLPPHSAYKKALEEGDFESAFLAAQRYGKKRDRDEYTAMMGVLATVGLEKACQTLEDLLIEETSKSSAADISGDMFMAASGSVKRYYEGIGEPEEGLNRIKSMISRIQEMEGENNTLLAFLYNQLGMIYWGKDAYAECIDATQRAIELEPSEGSYLYNLALAYDQVHDEPRLISTLKKLKSMNSDDEDHASLIKRHGL